MKGTVRVCSHPKKIIFNRINTRFSLSFLYEVGIAKTLQLLGHDVLFVICGQVMERCTPEFSVQVLEPERICMQCSRFGGRFLSAVGLRYIDCCRCHTIEDVDICCIDASVDRYFRGIVVRDIDKEEYIRKVKQRNQSVSLATAEYLYSSEKPDIVFSTHYGYAEWNPFYRYMCEKGVRCITWDYSYGDSQMIFDLESLGVRYTSHVLSDKEKQHIEQYLVDRKQGRVDTRQYQFDPLKKPVVSGYVKKFCIYPNLPWDTSLINSNKVFQSVYEWVDKTILFFKEHPEYFLYIKVHPAEKTDGSFETIADYIRQHHSLSDNICIVDVDSDVSAYSLFDCVDVGLVYNGTVGIEMVSMGKPVILAGDIFYRGKGFTYDAENMDHYFSLIQSVNDVSVEMVEKAKQFAYYYMIQCSIPLKYACHSLLGCRYTVSSFDRLLEDKGMNKIISYILKEEEIC